MNLADAIRQAAQHSGHQIVTETVPTESSEITYQKGLTPMEKIDHSVFGDVHAEGQIPEAPHAAVLGGSVVRLELFLAPDQLNNLFKSVVSNQHTVMTLREAASFLRISTTTLDQMATDREVPALQIDGKWRFSRASLEEWLTFRAAIQEEKEA